MAVWAFLVAVEEPWQRSIPAVPYADSSIAKLEASLVASGWPREQLVVCRPPWTTRAVLEARFQAFCQRLGPEDACLLVWCGRGYDSATGFCGLPVDALAEHLEALSIPWGAWCEACPAGRVLALIDRFPFDNPETTTQQSSAVESPAGRSFAGSASASRITWILSAQPGEHPQAMAGWKSTLFMKLLSEAFAGQAHAALTDSGDLTTASLAEYLVQELPRRLARHWDVQSQQTIEIRGHPDDTPWLRLQQQLGGRGAAFLRDPAHLARVFFRKTDSRRVRDLSEWRKTFQLPESASASSRKFVARIAQADVNQRLDQIVQTVREVWQTKRKDLLLERGTDGTASLRTPDFLLQITAQLDPQQVQFVRFTEELSEFLSLDFLRSEGFENAFGTYFEELTLSFLTPWDWSSWIDAIEARPPAGWQLKLLEDDHCEITVTGTSGKIRLSPHAITVQGRSGLLMVFLQFLDRWQQQTEGLALPS